jgi:hypothetical protein
MTSIGIKVGKAKIKVIEKLEFSNDIKVVRSFLRHYEFY